MLQDLLEWRKRQGKAAWYGLWSIIIGKLVQESLFIYNKNLYNLEFIYNLRILIKVLFLCISYLKKS